MTTKLMAMALTIFLFAISCKRSDVIEPKEAELSTAQEQLKEHFDQANVAFPAQLKAALKEEDVKPNWQAAQQFAQDTKTNLASFIVPVLSNKEAGEYWLLNVITSPKKDNYEWVRYTYSVTDGKLQAADYFSAEGTYKVTADYSNEKAVEWKIKGPEGIAIESVSGDAINRWNAAMGIDYGDSIDGGTLGEVTVSAPRYDPPPMPPYTGSDWMNSSDPWKGESNKDYSYEYSTGGGGSSAPTPVPKDITNEITTPCLKKTLNDILVSKLENSITKSMQTLYNKNTDANLFFRDNFKLEKKTDGVCSPEFRSSSGDKIFIDCVIELNNNTLENSSKEYVAATILHEGIHAIMRYNGLTDKMDHFDMALSYVEVIANGMREIYPNISYNDAYDLAWGGLHESASWNYLKNTNPGLASRISATNDYYKRNVVGTPNCK